MHSAQYRPADLRRQLQEHEKVIIIVLASGCGCAILCQNLLNARYFSLTPYTPQYPTPVLVYHPPKALLTLYSDAHLRKQGERQLRQKQEHMRAQTSAPFYQFTLKSVIQLHHPQATLATLSTLLLNHLQAPPGCCGPAAQVAYFGNLDLVQLLISLCT